MTSAQETVVDTRNARAHLLSRASRCRGNWSRCATWVAVPDAVVDAVTPFMTLLSIN